MSASRYDLLPPNATQLERDLSRVTSSLVRTGPPVPLIRTAKRTNIPDSVVPWLIYEYGLGEILPFLGNNQRQALAEGVLWQRIRGTPESVRIALSWIGINGLIEESEGGTYRWAEYQLGLSAATTGDEIINNIAGLARISSPVRSRLQRIYAVYDMRMGVFDETSFDECIYDDHSGVRPRPDWPQISYGQNHARYVSRDGGSVSSALTIGHGAHILMIDHLRYDYSRFDEDSDIINYSSNLTISDLIASSARYEGQTWTAISWRQDKTWADVNAVVSSSWTTGLSSGVLLLHMNGSDGSVTFTDDSPNNWTITRVLNNNAQPAISTAQSKFGGASAYFDQTSRTGYLQTPSSPLFDPSGKQFTMECWVYNDGNVAWWQNVRGIFGYRGGGEYCPFSVMLNNTSVRILVGNSSVDDWLHIYNSPSIAALNAWSHIRLVGNGANLTLAVNGAAIWQGTQPAWTPASRTVYIGVDGDGKMTGHIDEFLFVHEAFQADNFTPPSAPYRID